MELNMENEKVVGVTNDNIREMWAADNGSLYYICTNNEISSINSLLEPTKKCQLLEESRVLNIQPIYNKLFFSSDNIVSSFDLETQTVKKEYDYGEDEQIISIVQGRNNGFLFLNSWSEMISSVDWEFQGVCAASYGLRNLKYLNSDQVLQKYIVQDEEQENQGEFSYCKIYNIEYNTHVLELKQKNVIFFFNTIAQYNGNCLFLSMYNMDDNRAESYILDRRIGKKVMKLMDKTNLQFSPEHVCLVKDKVVGLANCTDTRWLSKYIVVDVRNGQFVEEKSYQGRLGGLCRRGSTIYNWTYKRQEITKSFKKTVYRNQIQ